MINFYKVRECRIPSGYLSEIKKCIIVESLHEHCRVEDYLIREYGILLADLMLVTVAGQHYHSVYTETRNACMCTAIISSL